MPSESMRYLAQKSNFVDFFAESVNENNDSIKRWVEKNLLDRSKKVDNEIIKAFFAAEKSLLAIYIQEGKIEALSSLVKLFKQINNDTVDKIGLTMLGSLLQEEKSQIIQNPNLQQALRDTFLSFENTVKIYSKHDETIKHSWESAEEILGQLVGEDLSI